MFTKVSFLTVAYSFCLIFLSDISAYYFNAHAEVERWLSQVEQAIMTAGMDEAAALTPWVAAYTKTHQQASCYYLKPSYTSSRY